MAEVVFVFVVFVVFRCLFVVVICCCCFQSPRIN